MDKIPNPGSDAALRLGCKCPVMDNAHGEGCGMKDTEGKPLFWISGNCPLHGHKEGDAHDKNHDRNRDPDPTS